MRLMCCIACAVACVCVPVSADDLRAAVDAARLSPSQSTESPTRKHGDGVPVSRADAPDIQLDRAQTSGALRQANASEAKEDQIQLHIVDSPPVVVPTPSPDRIEGEIISVPTGTIIYRHHYNTRTGMMEGGERPAGGGGSAIDPDTISYANEPPTHIYRPGAGNRIADDVRSVAVEGCMLTVYEISVGGVGTGADFTVDFALWDGCPSAGGQQIDGTGGSMSGLADDAVHLIEVTLDPPILVPQSFWFSTTFDSDTAGWFVGTSAEIGYTENTFDYPFFPCSAWTGTPGRYGGFHLRTFCQPPFEREFAAYLNRELDGMLFSPGAGNWVTDDITLIVNDCVLSSFEIGCQGNIPFAVEAELGSSCSLAGLIPGTEGVAFGRGDGTPEILRFDFPGGVPLPQGQDTFWLSWRYTTNASAIIAGQAELGFTENSFGLQPDSCLFFFPDLWNGFSITLRCLGDPPVGACCPRDIGEICRETSGRRCAVEEGRWIRGATCEPDPFDPPCGTTACCLSAPLPTGSCENLTTDECQAQGGVPEPELFCRESGQDCGVFACRTAANDCMIAHDDTGCMELACCHDVCAFDSWCCTVEWDAVCVRWAEGFCRLAPRNDVCVDADPELGALLVLANSTTVVSNAYAGWSVDEPGLCCHPQRPGKRAGHTVWFRFEATHTSARLHTCDSDPPADDSILAVFSVGDPSTPETACTTLTEIACNDDRDGCTTGANSDLCISGLVPGETYYAILGVASTSDRSGVYRFTIESPCGKTAPVPACPPGAIEWIDPPDGVVDARQPHRVESSDPKQGIDAVTFTGPDGVDDPCCWTLCDPDGVRAPDMEWEFVALGEATYRVALPDVIAAGEITELTYHVSDGAEEIGHFISHPANVDGDGEAGPGDIPALIAFFDGTNPLPWGIYSCDMDHSGECDAADLLRLIDLLNGGGALDTWNGTELPVESGPCPRP